MRHNQLKIDGKVYAVTDKFETEVLNSHPDLAELHYDALAVERDKLLLLSTKRANYEIELPSGLEGMALTAEEYNRLECIVHVMNCHKAARFLCGRSFKEFQFTGIDQVHGNRTVHGCGCVSHHVLDHHKRLDSGELKLHPHPHPFDKVCDEHK